MAYTPAAGWGDLPLDLLGGVIARLPFPADRARFAAVCRAWRSAVRQHGSHLPWIVFPSCTFCTAGHGAACFSFLQIPGLADREEDVTCLGAAHDCWLALDCTDDIVRRTTLEDSGCDPDTGEPLVYPRRNVKHKHTYLLHNPFSNLTVPLPELDAIVGHVAETFHIRKVLMRSPAPQDDVIAVMTTNCNYNIILCRPGKGTFVLPYYRIIDVVFLGDMLYGITSGEELLAFHLGEDEDGRPSVTRIELVITNPLSRYYYHEFPWFWPEDVDKGAGEDEHNNGGGELSDSNNEEDEDSSYDVEEPNQEENDNSGADEGYLQEEDRNEDEESDDDDELADQALEDIFNGDDVVSNNLAPEVYEEAFEAFDEDVPYEPKDEMVIRRYLVKSRSDELLLVRHRYLSSPCSDSYTHNVEVLKVDPNKGKWAASNGLDKGEALFLSQSYNKCTLARGDVQEGFVYYTTHLVDDAYDMTCCTTRNITFGWVWQCRLQDHWLLTWLFPPEVVV
ncbi:hypothetical protein BDA96_07G008000 [Sorghum bicolor]|uniref:F-box domain-containing protein n=2 Tax=Sorghum bicolor TaxID=4558 RepID=A0A921U7X5_SORBI|nr:hypothetical protein SORBI_3007G007600 [Sorghum bicolor]KAG0522102.1 hypothetical protein BDA96_07G008000 [Sorghum bicolor]